MVRDAADSRYMCMYCMNVLIYGMRSVDLGPLQLRTAVVSPESSNIIHPRTHKTKSLPGQERKHERKRVG